MSSIASPPTATTAKPTIGWHTILFLLVFYFLAMIEAGIQLLGSNVTNTLVQLVAIVNLGLWAIEDARRRRHPIPLSTRPWIVMLSAVAVPGYVIYTRGWRGILWITFHFIGYWIVLMAAYTILFILAFKL